MGDISYKNRIEQWIGTKRPSPRNHRTNPGAHDRFQLAPRPTRDLLDHRWRVDYLAFPLDQDEFEISLRFLFWPAMLPIGKSYVAPSDGRMRHIS
jgi:hypothetical protein